MKFDLGVVTATPGALSLLHKAGLLGYRFVSRHAAGDWGNVPPEDARQNELALRDGERLLSSYDVAGEALWIITEADRSVTTLLLPSEY